MDKRYGQAVGVCGCETMRWHRVSRVYGCLFVVFPERVENGPAAEEAGPSDGLQAASHPA